MLRHEWNNYNLRYLEGSQLKGHGNEPDFLGFLQKLVPHRSLILPFEPFRFWLRIRGDIRNRKTTPRIGEPTTPRLAERVGKSSRKVSDSPTRRVGELAFECLKEKTASRRVGNSPTWRVGELSTPRLAESGSRYGKSGSCYSNFLKFFLTLNS